ncbi:hypothetical protein ACFVVA_12590 [Kitasatospora sp. NPDC058048]|uniref:hypothetical protein n=1 Tax=Kitasatospora sp. NPDC058048 TaxID=3346313 RepID=UPI0036D89540
MPGQRDFPPGSAWQGVLQQSYQSAEPSAFLAFRQPFLAGGNGDAAYTGFLVAYAGCSALTWAVWLRWRWRWRWG